MKKMISKLLLFIGISIVAFLIMAADGYAAPHGDIKMSQVVRFGDHFALVRVVNADAGVPLNGPGIDDVINAERKKLGIGVVVYTLHDKGNTKQIRAFGRLVKNTKDKHIPFTEFAKQDGLRAKFVHQNMIHFDLFTPRQIHKLYAENEVIADEMFKKRTIVFFTTINTIQKDFFGNPYTIVKIDQYGFEGVHITFKKNDHFLKYIRKGSKVTVKGTVSSFNMQNLHIDGIIVSDELRGLVDGKIYSLDEIAND